MIRIIYMGTPFFAVPALEALIQGSAPGSVLPEGYEIVTVITRTDKPSGRAQEIVYAPVKQVALAHGLPVWQPGSFKKVENQEALAAYQADLFIVAAFGQILPQAVLDLPRYGTLNIHASLLPKYRGSSPISEAILQGEIETGVTIMLIDAGIDTGPILFKRTVPIAERETTASLTTKLANLGASALLEALPLWIQGRLTPEPQDHTQASYTRMIKKEDGRIDWSRPAEILDREIRAYTPWPNAYTTWRGKLLKILSAYPLPSSPPDADQPGKVSLDTRTGVGGTQKVLRIATGQGSLMVERVQLEGRKAMCTDEFVRGYASIVGDVLK
ncbi:MAG TPA: methionyl-tRNA formyltransferase [Ktedonobacteraceae bacterium]|nr:methionyl-tRNA formyltransferase [Ktedonobacteraceae bacterium]